MKFRQMIIVALFTALMSIFAPLALPFGPIPVSFATLIIYITVGLLGTKSVFAVMLYILIGAAGLPVFSYGSGGFDKIIGPTGGFILGYLACALISGLIIKHFGYGGITVAVSFVIGTVVLYSLGTIWFSIYTGGTFLASLFACVIVFIPSDIIKILCAVAMIKIVKNRIRITKYIK